MRDIEYEILKKILIEVKAKIGFKRFEELHEYVSSKSLNNYLDKNMRPTNKKFKYIISCLKQYHSNEYKEILNNIEKRYEKPLDKVIKESILKEEIYKANIIADNAYIELTGDYNARLY